LNFAKSPSNNLHTASYHLTGKSVTFNLIPISEGYRLKIQLGIVPRPGKQELNPAFEIGFNFPVIG
jgi:hypothetical protein